MWTRNNVVSVIRRQFRYLNLPEMLERLFHLFQTTVTHLLHVKSRSPVVYTAHAIDDRKLIQSSKAYQALFDF